MTEHIEQNLDKDLPLAELTALVYMSPYHFVRLSRGSTGVPSHRFVIRPRIARARPFLATHELSIAQISRMVTAMLRRVTGSTPRGYRTGHVRADRPAGKEREKVLRDREQELRTARDELEIGNKSFARPVTN